MWPSGTLVPTYIIFMSFMLSVAGPIKEMSSQLLLKALGMRREGSIAQHVPEYMVRLYDEASRLLPYGSTSAYALPLSGATTNWLEFVIPKLSHDESIIDSELHLHHGRLRRSGGQRLRDTLPYKVEVALFGRNESRSQLMYDVGRSWIRFRLGNLLRSSCKHIENPEYASGVDMNRLQSEDQPNDVDKDCDQQILRFHVNLTNVNGERVKLRLHGGKERTSFLVLFTKSLSDAPDLKSQFYLEGIKHLSNVRTKRSLLTENSSLYSNVLQAHSGEGSTCRRESLYVDFREFGWTSWLIAPVGFDAHFCSGSCTFPLGAENRPTNHAVVTMVKSLLAGNSSYAPKCVPSSYHSLNILFVDDNNNVVLKRHNQMAVKSCSCR